jgi:hypothetical protein
MLDKSKVVIQTKRDMLVLQVGGWAWGCSPILSEVLIVEKLLTITGWQHLKQPAKLRTFECEPRTCCPYIEVGHFQRVFNR